MTQGTRQRGGVEGGRTVLGERGPTGVPTSLAVLCRRPGWLVMVVGTGELVPVFPMLRARTYLYAGLFGNQASYKYQPCPHAAGT